MQEQAKRAARLLQLAAKHAKDVISLINQSQTDTRQQKQQHRNTSGQQTFTKWTTVALTSDCGSVGNPSAWVYGPDGLSPGTREVALVGGAWIPALGNNQFDWPEKYRSIKPKQKASGRFSLAIWRPGAFLEAPSVELSTKTEFQWYRQVEGIIVWWWFGLPSSPRNTTTFQSSSVPITSNSLIKIY